MIRAGDYVRDVLAVVFLLTALGSAWEVDQAAAPDYLVPVTLLSILSLALPYLRLASVLPRVLTPGRIQHVRLLANTPYMVVVLISLAHAYGGARGAAEVGAGRGVGIGVMFGLVGVVLAAQGRESEFREGARGRGLWTITTVVLAGLGVALAVTSAVLYIVEFAGEAGWGEIAVVVVDMIFFAGVPVLAVRGLVRGDGVWRDVAIVLGGIGLLAALWAQGAGETMRDAWSLRLAGPQVLFWPAIGAAAAAPGITSLLRMPAGVRWVNVVSRLFQLVTLVAVAAVVMHGFRLVDDAGPRGAYLTGIVLSLLALVIATVGRNALVRDAVDRRLAAVGAALGLIAVALVEMSVLGISASAVIRLDIATVLCVWFVVAVVAAVVLVGPASVSAGPGDSPAETASSESADTEPRIYAEDESIWTAHDDSVDGAEPSSRKPAQLPRKPPSPGHESER